MLLSGILVTTTFGVAAQLKEESEKEIQREQDAAQSLSLLQNTNKAVIDIRRAMSPLTDPLLTGTFFLPCDGDFKAQCDEIIEFRTVNQNKLPTASIWSKWPYWGTGGGFNVSIYVYKNLVGPLPTTGDSSSADYFLNFQIMKLIGAANSANCGAKPTIGAPGAVVYDGCDTKMITNNSKGTILSVDDLSNAVVVIVAAPFVKSGPGLNPPPPPHLVPESVSIRFPNGRSVSLHGLTPSAPGDFAVYIGRIITD